MNDKLRRFLDAQALMYQQALKEIENGKKEDHWIWFIFPQLKGLGKSNGSRFFSFSNIDEVRAFYEHDILGKRLKEITNALLYNSKSPKEIMSDLDATKVRSCMTLFYLATGDVLFKDVIDKWYDGEMCCLTQKFYYKCINLK